MMATKKKGFWIFLVLVLAVGMVGVYFTHRDVHKPVISIAPEITHTNGTTPFEIRVHDAGAGLKSVEILVLQNQQVKKTTQEKFDVGVHDWQTMLELPGMAQGTFQLQVRAVDRSTVDWGRGNLSGVDLEINFDNIPPSISIATTVHNLNQGGAGLVIYSLSEEVERTGVRLGDSFFPAVKQEDGKYHCLFAFPYNAAPGRDIPRIEARDKAGNEQVSGFNHHVNPRPFRQARLNISDSFLQSQMPQFQRHFPEESELFRIFLRVNRELRTQTGAMLQSLSAKTTPLLILERELLRLPNSAQMAGFADQRTYYYQDQEVDRQVHLGVDLASIAQAQVPAAADGRVVLTGDLGIYGQTVILDHGLGLQTMYAHLSSMEVQNEQQVIRGQTMGRTGTTGLAVGDHLHFEVLVSGASVNPREWWDRGWLENNIFSKLRSPR